MYTNFPIRQSPSENTEGYELEKSCHSTLPFSKMPLPRGDNTAHHLRRKNNVIASHFPLLGKLCLQSKCSTLKMQKTYCPFSWRLHFSRIYVCTTYLLTWVNKYLLILLHIVHKIKAKLDTYEGCFAFLTQQCPMEEEKTPCKSYIFVWRKKRNCKSLWWWKSGSFCGGTWIKTAG